MSRSSPPVQETTLQGQYAGFVSRLIAFFFDRIIILLVILIINTTVIVVLGFFNIQLEQVTDIQDANSTLEFLFSLLFILLALIINFVLYYGYFIIFWMLVGQTPGKMIMGVRIVSTDGSPIGFIQSIIRLVGYWISMIVVFMGYFWVLISDTRQGWHDKLAKTYVIYSWEAQPSYKFFKRLAHFADKRAKAYEAKHPTPVANKLTETAAERSQETAAD